MGCCDHSERSAGQAHSEHGCAAGTAVHAAAPAFRLWLIVLCGYLALGETLQVLPSMTASRFEAGPVLVGPIAVYQHLQVREIERR